MSRLSLRPELKLTMISREIFVHRGYGNFKR